MRRASVRVAALWACFAFVISAGSLGCKKPEAAAGDPGSGSATTAAATTGAPTTGTSTTAEPAPTQKGEAAKPNGRRTRTVPAQHAPE
jgi:hypothetical protein